MDKKLIQQFGQDILSYRIRTNRRKIRAQYEDFDKYLIRLSEEEKSIWKRKAKLGWAPLEPPVQKGWKRFFVLRDDVARSRDADFFAAILKKINTYDWSHRKDFKVKKRTRGYKKYIVKTQKLLEPCESHFLKLGFSETEKQFFHSEAHYEKWLRKSWGPFVRYVFNEPWRYVLRIKPNMIDKVRIRDHELEARKQRLDNYLKKNDFRKRQFKVIHGCHPWRYKDLSKDNYFKNILKNKPLHQIIQEAAEEVL